MRSKPFFMFDQKLDKRSKRVKRIFIDKEVVQHEHNMCATLVFSEMYYSYHGNICLVSNTVDQHRPLTEKKVNRTQAKVFRVNYGMSFKLGSVSIQK